MVAACQHFDQWEDRLGIMAASSFGKSTMVPTDNPAFIVVDVQNDFCTGGALAVAEGERVVPVINAMMPHFDTVVFTQDWHPANHVSFAANHAGAEAFTRIRLDYGDQTLWPVHCVQGSHGAAFHPALDECPAQMVVRKGFRSTIDSYSAFFENDRRTETGLQGFLASRGISQLVLGGLATDFCVAWSALDAAALGFDTTVVLAACRAIDLEGSLATQLAALRRAGVRVVETFEGPRA